MTDTETSLIVGAEKIAAALGITREQFYKARYKGGLPFVWQEPGLGLTTTRALAANYLIRRATGKSAEDSALSRPTVNAA